MKITIGPISLDLLLCLRLWWPAIVFIVSCAGVFLPFSLFLPVVDQIAPRFIGGVWFLLLIFYVILGVAFTYFAARLLRRSFGSEEWRVQKHMVILSGFPFYAFRLVLLVTGIYVLLNPALSAVEMIGAVVAISFIGTVGFALISCSYVFLALFFLRRSPAVV
ncbi:hypothetical protein KDA_57120 [Dictyobacter alpinus]|uniref:DUF2975 domain-containing protein n=1 Tax=Dictyobacter alpinus TaxID=2014873 RepID=A0A402BFQ0_9CHLR|nr:hypothetical protein [Dictyobacter alpinus]GCE30228.1 hypothetical protein KDA_57120 [Dictyobacter alpinus]